eukprot:3404956-Amphidinium_carterae.2
MELGQHLFARIEKVIRAVPTLRSQCLDALGNPIVEGPDVKFVTIVQRLLQSAPCKFIRMTGRSVPADIQMGQPEVRPDLLALWVNASGDPDTTVPRWLVESKLMALH